MTLQKHDYIHSQKIRRSAKGEKCLANFPGCTWTQDDVCLRHINEGFTGRGMKIKGDDIAAFYGCQHCEDLYAGLITENQMPDYQWKLWTEDKHLLVLRAMYRTIKRLIEKQILVIK